MHHVLLVDDEVHAVRGLQAGVDWERLNISAIHTAHSLKQAQDVFRSQPVSLMICDIEMPMGSGLDLLEWTRENFPRTETIFLTCHSDFSFAKQAIHLQSFGYLLKPVDYSELEGVIANALEKIRKDRELHSFEETYKHYLGLWDKHRPVMAERFWQDLLRQTFASTPEAVREQASRIGLIYSDDVSFLSVYITVREWHQAWNPRDERIMEFALRNAAEEGVAGRGTVVPLEAGSLLAAIPSEAEFVMPPVQAACDSFIAFCNSNLHCDINCYIGKPVKLHEMPAMLRRLQDLDENNVTRVNRTLFLYETGKKENRTTRMPPAPVEEWALWMKQGARERLTAGIVSYLDSWRGDEVEADSHSLHLFYQDFLQMVYFILQSKGLQANLVFSRNLMTDKPATVLRSVSSLREWVLYVLSVAMNRLHDSEENMSIVDKVKRYIHDQLGLQSLSREDVANHVFLNPDYLTRVFKKETGFSISDYMQQQRIEFAKRLLCDSRLSVSDIAVEIGYTNLSYFSTLFKRTTGLNPIDYRKQCSRR
ncbi:response regulator transcription factor [Cohnella herbarum]|uniref:Helix-turn-helix domain-containing protein n=1 Tax=Cohnella herbarum TaxID=2728023 RepID=A0A7Z2ZLA3_9BACL|nr:helix-turn-helix domain-containing protein [Cohnella herbarum]QJD82837.1 helix-turn-helix domain-containing protein [Cohnella herbarum]